MSARDESISRSRLQRKKPQSAPLATAGSVADGQYAITTGGTVKAAVSRQLVRAAPNIGVDIGDEDDTAVLLARMLAIEAIRYERGESYFSPGALMELLNPLRVLLGRLVAQPMLRAAAANPGPGSHHTRRHTRHGRGGGPGPVPADRGA